MEDIKNIIRQQLSESFFDKHHNPLNELSESFKNIFFNLKYSIGQPYKLDYLKVRLKEALAEYKNYVVKKYNPKNIEKIEKRLGKVINDIEPELVEAIGLDYFKAGLVGILSKNTNIDRVHHELDIFFTSYVNTIDERIEKLFNLYKEIFSQDTTYEPLRNMSSDKSSMKYKEFLKQKHFLQIELLKLQEWAVENNQRIIILYEGRDSAGKGSNIISFTENLNPKHFRVETFGVPTREEKLNWFKRYKKVLPQPGEIVLFDRSWYNRAVIEPVMGYCSDKEYNDFMNKVNGFEKNLIEDGVILIKLWFSITENIQRLRFEYRKRDPLNYWKYSENDKKVLNKWDKFTYFIDEMFKKTSTKRSPWVVIDANDKRISQLNAMRYVLRKISYSNKNPDVLMHQETPKQNIIFLDIHGTVITGPHVHAHNEEECNEGWNSQAIENVNKLAEESDSKVVITSTCKNYENIDVLKSDLTKAGLRCKVIGETSHIGREFRGTEIKIWIAKHDVKNFVILDDSNDNDIPENFPNNFVHLDHHVGFSDKSKLKEAIKKISNLGRETTIREMVRIAIKDFI